ncbi:uncharacterized protein [Ptychodera flava]|uniref:uncharacterized protein n=1 Tax=Ptychodera flava TaxID=63121 RepID=UPI00396A874E
MDSPECSNGNIYHERSKVPTVNAPYITQEAAQQSQSAPTAKQLKKLENIQYVVGYAPKTGFAAAIIKNRLFPGAQLVLINHICPGEKHLLVNVDEQKLANIMLEMASKADILFSIGPKIYEHFEDEYKANFNQKQLSDIPHEVILPKPESIFFEQTIKGGDRCNILTYGEYNTQETLNKNQVMAESIGKAAYFRNECYYSLPCWRIQGISPNAKDKDKNKLMEHMKSPLIHPKFYSDCSVGALMTTLQQSDLCLPSPYYMDYGLQGLEAMAAGLPTMTEDDSQLACFMKGHFEDHADDCIIRDPKQNLYKKILWTMRFPDKAFRKAAALKKTFQEHALLGSAKFTSLLTNNETLQPTQKNNTVPGVEGKQTKTSEKTSKQRQTLAVQHEVNVPAINATQGALTMQFSSSYAAPGKAENPRSQNNNPTKSERSQQEGTHFETENPSQTNMKRQHTSSGKNDRATEAKKRKQEFQEQPIKIDDTMPQQGGTGFIQHKNKAALGENIETGETSELQRTKGSQSEVIEMDVTQGTQEAESQPMTTCAMTSHNPHKTMTLHNMVEPGTVPGKCEETQPEKAVQRSNGVENAGEMKSQMETGGGGERISEKHTGSGEEEQGSNKFKLKVRVDQEPFMLKDAEDAEPALTVCQNRLLQTVIERLADEGGRQKIADICKDNLGVDPSDLRAGCLEILLKLPGLYNLYRVKQTCKSANLAKAFEPLLITDEMREIAAKVGVTLQLKATYDEESFKEVELFFINRDGGGVKPIEVYTYFERKDIEEILFDANYAMERIAS